MRTRLAALLCMALAAVIIRGVSYPRPEGREGHGCCLTKSSSCYTVPPGFACYPGDRQVLCPCGRDSSS